MSSSGVAGPPRTETIRFRRPETGEPKKATIRPLRHTGILQDQVRRSAKRPWAPDFAWAVRWLLLIRFSAAMYANITDCDEVFNFWEPLHLFDRGYGFQTWEVSPEYSIRSWAYIVLHWFPVQLSKIFIGPDKRPAFFAVRAVLGLASTLIESYFYRSVYTHINERVGRYLFFMLSFNAGMWNAAPAFLPSSFAMHACTLAFAYAMEPCSIKNNRRTLAATVLFATAAIVGWPFSLALAIPFVYEELFVVGSDTAHKDTASVLRYRWIRFITYTLLAGLVAIPVIGIDTAAYGKLTIVPWNIISYNIFGGALRGPELYGTEPWNFYILNLLLNFNVLLPFALLSLPALLLTKIFDRKRLDERQANPTLSLALRLAPFYLWLGILSAQPHKEERFMYPVYPMLCFNAAVAVYLVKGWMEVIFIKATNSPYRAAQTSIFSNFSSSVVLATCVLSISRIMALWYYYHAPQSAYFQFEHKELPRLLNVTGMLPPLPPHTREKDMPRIDLSPIKDFNLILCVGKEWHRFPGHYHVPDGVRVEFVKSEFSGLLPGHFGEDEVKADYNGNSALDGFWPRPVTRLVPVHQNDLNIEEPRHYGSIEQCDYMVDLDFPLHPSESPLEPRYALIEEWERVACYPFLDARFSPLATRALWMPGEVWQRANEYGDYCLLRHGQRVEKKIETVLSQQK
ncbi:glycosyltransferase family 22 protein [Schizophyllum commune]